MSRNKSSNKPLSNKSQRQLQIGENIKRIMSEIFLRDDYSIMMNNVITIIRADVSPDAKNVKFFIDICGDESKHQQIVKNITDKIPHFRHKLAQKIDLRTIPEITFIHNTSLARATEIQMMIESEAQKNLNQNFQESPATRRKK